MLVYREVIEDFLKIHLPPHLKKQVNLNSLRREKSHFIRSLEYEFFSDYVCSVQIPHVSGHLYCIIEHVTKPSRDIPVKFLEYQEGIIRYHQGWKSNHIPLIVPFMVYQGSISPYPTSLNIPNETIRSHFLEKELLHPIELIDLSITPDTVLKQNKHLALIQLIQKYSFKKNLDGILDYLKDKKTSRYISSKIFSDIIRYLEKVTPRNDWNILYPYLEEYLFQLED